MLENLRAARSDAKKKAQIEGEFARLTARLEELEEAVAINRKDTTDLMLYGGGAGKYFTKKQIEERLKGEQNRIHELEALTKKTEEESWTGSVSRWVGIGTRVISGDMDAVKQVSDAAVAAVTPTFATKYRKKPRLVHLGRGLKAGWESSFEIVSARHHAKP